MKGENSKYQHGAVCRIIPKSLLKRGRALSKLKSQRKVVPKVKSIGDGQEKEAWGMCVCDHKRSRQKREDLKKSLHFQQARNRASPDKLNTINLKKRSLKRSTRAKNYLAQLDSKNQSITWHEIQWLERQKSKSEFRDKEIKTKNDW